MMMISQKIHITDTQTTMFKHVEYVMLSINFGALAAKANKPSEFQLKMK